MAKVDPASEGPETVRGGEEISTGETRGGVTGSDNIIELSLDPLSGLCQGGQTIEVAVCSRVAPEMRSVLRHEIAAGEVRIRLGGQDCPITSVCVCDATSNKIQAYYYTLVCQTPKVASPGKYDLEAEVHGEAARLADAYEYVTPWGEVQLESWQLFGGCSKLHSCLLFAAVLFGASEFVCFGGPWSAARTAVFWLLVQGLPLAVLLLAGRRLARNKIADMYTKPFRFGWRDLVCVQRGETIYVSFRHFMRGLNQLLPGVERCDIDGITCKVVRCPCTSMQEIIQAREAGLERSIGRLESRLKCCRFDMPGAKERIEQQVDSLREGLFDTKSECTREEAMKQDEMGMSLEMEWPHAAVLAKAGKAEGGWLPAGHKYARVTFGLANGRSMTFWIVRPAVRMLLHEKEPGSHGSWAVPLVALQLAAACALSATYILWQSSRLGTITTSPKSILFIMSSAAGSVALVLLGPLFTAACLHPEAHRVAKVDPLVAANGLMKLMAERVALFEAWGQDCYAAGVPEPTIFDRTTAETLIWEPSDAAVAMAIDGKDLPRASFSLNFDFRGDETFQRLRCPFRPAQRSHAAIVELRRGRGGTVRHMMWMPARSLLQRVKHFIDEGPFWSSMARSGAQATTRGHSAPILCCAVIQQFALTGAEDGVVKLWTASGHLLWNCRGHHKVSALAVAGNLFMSCDDELCTVLWELVPGGDPDLPTVVQRDLCMWAGIKIAMAQCSSGDVLPAAYSCSATGGRSAPGDQKRWNPNSFVYLWTFRGGRGAFADAAVTIELAAQVEAIAIAPDADKLAYATDSFVTLCDHSGEWQQSLVHCLPVAAIAFLPERLASCCGVVGDPNIYLWSFGGELLGTAQHPGTEILPGLDSQRGVHCLAACGCLLLSGSKDHTSVVWAFSPHTAEREASPAACLLKDGSVLRQTHAMEHLDDVVTVAAGPCVEAGIDADCSTAKLLSCKQSLMLTGCNQQGTKFGVNCWRVSESSSHTGIHVISSPDVMLQSAEAVQIVVPLGTTLLMSLQLLAFPLSSSFPWNHRIEPVRVSLSLAILDLDVLKVNVDMYEVWKTKFYVLATMTFVCIVLLYGDLFGSLRRALSGANKKFSKRILWFRQLVRTEAMCGDEAAVKRRLKAVHTDMSNANIFERRELDSWRDEWLGWSRNEREHFQTRFVKPFGEQWADPHAYAHVRLYSAMDWCASTLLYMLSTFLMVPVTKTLVSAGDCTIRDGVWTLDVAYHAGHTFECLAWAEVPWFVISGIAIVLWTPACFGLIAAHGRVAALVGSGRFGFLRPKQWQVASDKTTDKIPMGLVTRGTQVFKYDMTQQLCRYLICWFSILMSEASHTGRLAVSYVIISIVQLLSTVFFRPYAERLMWSLTISLNVASLSGCALGLFVVMIDDETVAYPVPLLFASWILSFGLFLVLWLCGVVHDAKDPPGILAIIKHQTAYTSLMQDHAKTAEVP